MKNCDFIVAPWKIWYKCNNATKMEFWKIEDIKIIILEHEVGDTLTIKIIRNEKVREVEVLVRDMDGEKGWVKKRPKQIRTKCRNS